MKKSINERVGYADGTINPVLRWQPGNALNTISVVSALSPRPEYWDELSYEHPLDIWGDPCDGRSVDEILDEPLTDEEWEQLLDCVEIR